MSSSPSVSPPAAKWEKGSADDAAYQKYLKDYAEYEQKYAAYERQVGATPSPPEPQLARPQPSSPIPQVALAGPQGGEALGTMEGRQPVDYRSPAGLDPEVVYQSEQVRGNMPQNPAAQDPDAFRSPQQPAPSEAAEAYQRAVRENTTDLRNITGGGMMQQQSPGQPAFALERRDSVPPVHRQPEYTTPNQPRHPSLAGPYGAPTQIMSPQSFLRSILSPQSGGAQQPMSALGGNWQSPLQHGRNEFMEQRQPRQLQDSMGREIVKEVPVEKVVFRDRIVEVPKIIEKIVYVNEKGVPVQHHDYERGQPPMQPLMHQQMPAQSRQFSPAWGQSTQYPVGGGRMMAGPPGHPQLQQQQQQQQQRSDPRSPPPHVGVGLLLEKNLANETFYVVKTVPGFAAHNSGKFEYGDVVTLIDRRVLTDLDEEQVKNMMMGPEGSPVTLDVRRNEETKFQVKLVRTLPTSALDPHAVSRQAPPMQVKGGLVVQTLDHADIMTKSTNHHEAKQPRLPSQSMKTPDQPGNRTTNQFDHLLHAFLTPELIPPSPDFRDARSATKSPHRYDPNSPSKIIGAQDPNNQEALQMLQQIDEANREASDQIRRINEANERVLHDLALENRRTEEEAHYRHSPSSAQYHNHASFHESPYPDRDWRLEPHMIDPRTPQLVHGAPALSPAFSNGYFPGPRPHSLTQSFSEGLYRHHPQVLSSSFSGFRDAPPIMPYAPPMRPHILSDGGMHHHGHPALARSISDSYVPRPIIPMDLSRSYGGVSHDDYTPGPVIPLDLSHTGGSREDPRLHFGEGRHMHFTPPTVSHSYSHEIGVNLSPATKLSQSFSSGQVAYSPSEYKAKQMQELAARGYPINMMATPPQNPQPSHNLHGMKVAPTVRESDLRMYASAGQAPAATSSPLVVDHSGFVPGTNYSPKETPPETDFVFEFEKGPQQTVQEPIGQQRQVAHGGQGETLMQPISDGVQHYISGGYTVSSREEGEPEHVET